MEHYYSSIKSDELLTHLNMDAYLNKRSQTPPHVVDKVPYLQDSRKCYGPSSLVALLVKASACNAGDVRGKGSGRSPGRNWQPLQYSRLEKFHGQAIAHGVARVGHDWVTKPPPQNMRELICSNRKRSSARPEREESEGGIIKGTRKLLGVMGMSTILIVVMVSRMHTQDKLFTLNKVLYWMMTY